jgi:predicted nucleotidyltransferase
MSGEDLARLERAAFEFARRVSRHGRVKCVFLFGSVAKGDVDRRSDIDVLVVLDTKDKPELLEEFEAISSAALDVGREFDRSIQLVVTNAAFSGLDDYFVETVLAEGKVLYARDMPIKVEAMELEPYSIVTYSLENLSQSDKMRVKRRLHGRVSRRTYKDKEYVSKYEGLVRELGGISLGRGSVLVPAKALQKLEDVLKEFKVRYRATPAWLSSYNIPKEG